MENVRRTHIGYDAAIMRSDVNKEREREREQVTVSTKLIDHT